MRTEGFLPTEEIAIDAVSTGTSRVGRGVGIAAFIAAVALISWGLEAGGGGRAGHDYIQFHAAARLLVARASPYDEAAQRREQARYRGDLDFGPYNRVGCLPYYYPPWLALACTPLAGLPFDRARVAWVTLNVGALLLAAVALGRLARFRSGLLAPAAAVIYFPALAAVYIGQTAPLVLLLAVAAWRALEGGRDVAAGLALAWLTMKPQLSVVLLPTMLLWAARCGRWRAIGVFALTLAGLAVACAAFVPSWPREMVQAPSRIPLLIAEDPRVGVTWPCLLRTIGLRGGALLAAYVTLAVPAAVLVARRAWGRSAPLDETAALAILAGFAVAPYAMIYDYTMLLWPLFGLVGRLRSRAVGAVLVGLFVAVPYLQVAAGPGALLPYAAWMPAVLAAGWIGARLRR